MAIIEHYPLKLLASALPRTVLSVANAAESPTALLARREMQSWRLLQLEPSSLRQANDFSAPTKLGTDGSYLAATLYRLASLNNPFKAYISSDEEATGMVYGQVANRLAELIDDVVNVWVDRDDRRDLSESTKKEGRLTTNQEDLLLSDHESGG